MILVGSVQGDCSRLWRRPRGRLADATYGIGKSAGGFERLSFLPGTLEKRYAIGVLAALAPEPEVSWRITPD